MIVIPYNCGPSQTMADLGLEEQVLIWTLRILSSYYDGVVHIQSLFRQSLPCSAAGIAAVSVARLSDLLDESERPEIERGQCDNPYLTPCERRLVALCAAVSRQDYAEMSYGAGHLVVVAQTAQVIDAVASYLAAMQHRGRYGRPAAPQPATLMVH